MGWFRFLFLTAAATALLTLGNAANAGIIYAQIITATTGQDPTSVEILREEPMKDELVPAQD